MTIFVAHAQSDEGVAAGLAKAIERRGSFVEMEQAERIGRPLLSNDVLVLLWSQRMQFEPGRLVMERRALDAWADGKLIVVKLDNTFLPVGMRDLETVDATFEQRRTFTWEEVATKVREAMRPAPQADEALPPARARAPAPSDGAGMQRKAAPRQRAPAKAKSGPTGILALLLLLFLAAGVGQLLTATTFTLPIGDDGLVFPAWGLLAFAGMWVVVALVVAMLGGGRAQPAPKSAPAPMAEEAVEAPAPATSQALFVSYSHADSPAVVPVVEAVKTNGNEIWMDKAGIQAGDGWAGEIVRAIKGAKGVLVMCSTHAFESDHVKREVYLADRYKKPLLPVFIEPAELPEDFEYFFAGLQWLELHKTPEAERGAALAKAVAAV